MAASEVEIVNQALALTNQSTIVSLADDKSAGGRFARVFYEPTRKACLTWGRWKFAIGRQADIAPELPAPTGTSFQNRFAMPADCLEVIGLHDPQEPEQNYSTSRDPWTVEGRYVLANGEIVSLIYTKNVVDTTLFHPLFDQFFVYMLAAKLAPAGASANAAGQAFLNEAQSWLRRAQLKNEFQAAAPEIVVNGFLDAYTGDQVAGNSRRYSWHFGAGLQP